MVAMVSRGNTLPLWFSLICGAADLPLLSRRLLQGPTLMCNLRRELITTLWEAKAVKPS